MLTLLLPFVTHRILRWLWVPKFVSVVALQFMGITVVGSPLETLFSSLIRATGLLSRFLFQRAMSGKLTGV